MPTGHEERPRGSHTVTLDNLIKNLTKDDPHIIVCDKHRKPNKGGEFSWARTKLKKISKGKNDSSSEYKFVLIMGFFGQEFALSLLKLLEFHTSETNPMRTVFLTSLFCSC